MNSHASNVAVFKPRRKQEPALQWELRLNRETFDFEVGVVSDAGNTIPLFTWRLASGADDADLGRFCAAWDRTCRGS